jgi:acyl carrier protein
MEPPRNNDDAFERVRDLISREFKIKPHKITPSSRIREDLGICGDDGIDLFTALHEQCGVDVSDYKHDQHFEPEGLNILAMFSKKWWKHQRPRSITVSNLADAVRNRKWEERNTQPAA